MSTAIYSPSTRLKINVQHKNLILPTAFGVAYKFDQNPFRNFGDKNAEEYDFPIVRSFD